MWEGWDSEIKVIIPRDSVNCTKIKLNASSRNMPPQ